MISDERLEQISQCSDVATLFAYEQRQMARELLALRKATIPEEFLNATQNASGMFELSEDCMCQLMNMLCSNPTDSTT